MEFKSKAHEEAYNRTRDFLHSLFGEVNVTKTNEAFALQEGSTFVYVRAFPIGEKKAGVEVFSYVVVDVPITEDLMRYLLTYNLRLMFGGFGLALDEAGKGAIVLTHTILGDDLRREDLYASVSSIAHVADDMDDRIVTAFGGRTALDKLSAVKHEPAEYWE
jgi:hypothetical protein